MQRLIDANFNKYKNYECLKTQSSKERNANAKLAKANLTTHTFGYLEMARVIFVTLWNRSRKICLMSHNILFAHRAHMWGRAKTEP